MKGTIKLKKLITITILLLMLGGCGTKKEVSFEETNFNGDYIKDELVLTDISKEGYSFKSNNTNSGAWVEAEKTIDYNLSHVKEGDVVTMVFDEEGEILEVNGKIIK